MPIVKKSAQIIDRRERANDEIIMRNTTHHGQPLIIGLSIIDRNSILKCCKNQPLMKVHKWYSTIQKAMQQHILDFSFQAFFLLLLILITMREGLYHA